jgi:ketosteroid isomerase-like protein
MKKSIQFLLMGFVTISAFLNPLRAQDVKKELDVFTKKFEDAYNKKDDKTLKTMFTTDAVRTEANGTVTTGDENITAVMVTGWTGSKPVLTIKHDKAEKQADGSVITSGTYHVGGTTDAGDKLDINGSYTNTVIKDKGKWKIAKMVLGS